MLNLFLIPGRPTSIYYSTKVILIFLIICLLIFVFVFNLSSFLLFSHTETIGCFNSMHLLQWQQVADLLFFDNITGPVFFSSLAPNFNALSRTCKYWNSDLNFSIPFSLNITAFETISQRLINYWLPLSSHRFVDSLSMASRNTIEYLSNQKSNISHT